MKITIKKLKELINHNNIDIEEYDLCYKDDYVVTDTFIINKWIDKYIYHQTNDDMEIGLNKKHCLIELDNISVEDHKLLNAIKFDYEEWVNDIHYENIAIYIKRKNGDYVIKTILPYETDYDELIDDYGKGIIVKGFDFGDNLLYKLEEDDMKSRDVFIIKEN